MHRSRVPDVPCRSRRSTGCTTFRRSYPNGGSTTVSARQAEPPPPPPRIRHGRRPPPPRKIARPSIVPPCPPSISAPYSSRPQRLRGHRLHLQLARTTCPCS